MTKSEIIIALVKGGFSFTFDYVDGTYGDDTRLIIFTKTNFISSSILMSKLDASHVDAVKSEYASSSK